MNTTREHVVANWRSPSPTRFRRRVYGVAGALLALLLVAEVGGPISPASPNLHSTTSPQVSPSITAIAASLPPLGLDSQPASLPAVRQDLPLPPFGPLQEKPQPIEISKPRAPPLPFTYLGTTVEDGHPTVFLHRNGMPVAVRGPGAIDDDYVVEWIDKDQLVLRYVPLNEGQILKLSTQTPSSLAAWPSSPDAYEQD